MAIRFLYVSNTGGIADEPPVVYIVAKYSEVLSQLMKENEERVNPSDYTTPASAFNTLAVLAIDSDDTRQHLRDGRDDDQAAKAEVYQQSSVVVSVL